MAIHLPSTIYTGGAERFNSQQNVLLYGQLMARKQAREDAFNQYYQNLYKNLNPAGMRQIDIDSGFSQKVADWQKNWIENKQRITNPKTPEDRTIANENFSRYQDLLMDATKSKEAAAHQMEAAKLKLSGKWNPTDVDMDVVEKGVSSSIYSPSHYKDGETMTQPYTIADYSLNVPQFEPKDKKTMWDMATQGIDQDKVPDLNKAVPVPQTGEINIPFTKFYNPDKIKTIADRYGNMVGNKNSPSYVHYYNLMHNQNFFDKANKVYQSVYGQNDYIDTPSKAAKAEAIMDAGQMTSTGYELKKDENLAFNKQLQLQAIRHANAKELVGMRHALDKKDKEVNDLWIDNYVNKLIDERSEDAAEYHFKDGVKYEHKIPIDPVIAKSLTKDGNSPDLLTVTSDGKLRPVYYKYQKDENGNSVPIKDKSGRFEINEIASVPISQDALKLALGKTSAGTKQTNIEMAVPSRQNSYLIKGKKYSEKQLLNMGYTLDQISPYKQK